MTQTPICNIVTNKNVSPYIFVICYTINNLTSAHKYKLGEVAELEVVSDQNDHCNLHLQ